MSDTSKPNEQTVRFRNDRTTELLFGIEPEGFYYDVEPGKVIEVVFIPYKDDNHTFYVMEDGRILLEVIAYLRVYYDGKEVYSN